MTLQKQAGTFHSSKHSFLYLGRYNSIQVLNNPSPGVCLRRVVDWCEYAVFTQFLRNGITEAHMKPLK